jgi:hypothetical protein
MTEAAEKTRFQTISVPDAELAEWYAVGWSYVGMDDSSPDHSVIAWELGGPIVAPFSEAMRIAEANAALGGNK